MIFETSLWLPWPRNEVFDFFKNAENLQRLTPDSLSFKILTPLPIQMKKGARIDYSLRLYGIPLKWQTEISEWEPPFFFVDTQLAGPYERWIHTHTFEEEDGGTRMSDRVDFIPRGGRLISPLVARFFVRREVEKIFNFRKEAILKILL